MKNKSKKMVKKDRDYSKLRTVFLTDRPNCMASIPGCALRASEIHHKKGRGEYHNDTNTWLSVCRSCHEWIEKHPKQSIELGLSIKRN
tara:strand:+ start:449 stop:712 length:264 start_codon:yes stop_codon:yes gene_type:complete